MPRCWKVRNRQTGEEFETDENHSGERYSNEGTNRLKRRRETECKVMEDLKSPLEGAGVLIPRVMSDLCQPHSPCI